MKKKIISILTISILLISNICVPVLAETSADKGRFWKNTFDFLKSFWEIGNLMEYPEYPTLEEYFEDWKQEENISDAPTDPTEQEFIDYLNNGVVINGDNITYTGNTWSFMQYLSEQYREDNKYIIGYSFDCTDNYVSYPQANNGISDLLSPKLGNSHVFVEGGFVRAEWSTNRSKANYIGIIDLANSQGTASGVATFYDFVSQSSANIPMKQINVWTPDTESSITWNNQKFYFSKLSGAKHSGNNSTPEYAGFNGLQNSIYIYYDVNNLPSNPNIPKYFTTDSYNQNITGDSYTTTTESIDNSITYSDVYNYITSNYDYSTNTYPSPTETNNYIDSFNDNSNQNNNNNNGGSGGSGSVSNTNTNNNNPVFNNNPNININLGIPTISGNTVSGNGSGGSGGVFDWISKIGSVIGDFIKNVGELLADVIKGISETITTVMEDVPTILSTIVNFVYGGLPDELKALVTLGLTCVVLVSVIKILRK